MLELTVAGVVAAVIWAYLLIAHGGYWLTTQRLPRAAKAARTNEWPDVTAIVPARDEAGILPHSLPTLLAQDYPGTLTVLVVDDNSDDGTAAVATRLGARVIDGKPREPGWAGKVWAMAQGRQAAKTTGYLLFTDADIAWDQGALKDLVRTAEHDDRAMVSQMALLRTQTQWERFLVPAFVYFFAQLYPFRRVNNPAARTAAAAGGCMLIRSDRLPSLEPVKNALIDDVALGQLIKKQSSRTWLGLTTSVRSIRPYDSLDSLWRMVARSAYTQLRYSPAMLLGTVLGLTLIYLVPPAATFAGLASADAKTTTTGAIAWALMSVSYLPMLRLYRLSPLRAPVLPAIALLYTAMTVDSARRYYAGRGGEWKGRTV